MVNVNFEYIVILGSDKNYFELSGIVGTSFTINEDFDLELRYNHGLTKVSNIIWTDD